MTAGGAPRASGGQALLVQPPAPEPVGQKEVISSPASQHQKEILRDYESLPQAVFPTGFKTGTGRRDRALAPGLNASEDAESGPRRRSYYPDEAFILTTIAPRGDDHRRRNDSATECGTPASDTIYSPSTGSELTRTLGDKDSNSDGKPTVDVEKTDAVCGLNAVTGQVGGGEAEEGNRGRRICGVRRRWVFVLCAVVTLAVIGIAVGVGVWATRPHRLGSTPPIPGMFPAPPPGTASGGLHPNARLAAISWDGDDNQTHRAVISQDRSGSLFASYRETNGTWTPVRVSSLLEPLASIGGSLNASDWDPAPGTPIAAAVSSTSGLNIFFMTQRNRVFSIRSPKDNRSAWDWTELSRDMGSRSEVVENIPINGSDIAAATRRVCIDPKGTGQCFNDVHAVYLDSGLTLRLFNETQWRLSASQKEPLRPLQDSGSSPIPGGLRYPDLASFVLAMTYFPQDNTNGNSDGAMRVMFADGDGDPQQIVSTTTADKPYRWTRESIRPEERPDPGPLVAGKMAMSTFDGGTQMLMVKASPSGSALSVRHWARESYFWADSQRFRINGRPNGLPTKIISLAMTSRHLYTNNNGTIEEYQWVGSEVYTIEYKGIVDIFPIED